MKRVFLMMAFALATECAFAQFEWSAKETARRMAPGWNLGNTLEAGNKQFCFTNQGVDTEVSWQRVRTTQALIDYVKSLGFKSIRIPCAWVMGHVTDSVRCTIDPAWMARVREVVDYCIKADLYVVLNQHWDGGWLENRIADGDSVTVARNKEILRAVWTQIATAFRDYDARLLFAGLNEPNAATAVEVQRLVMYEQVFVDAVRATGGNNARRVLIVQGPNTDIETTARYLNDMPQDAVPDRLMLEVHYYTPWQFAGMERDEGGNRMAYYWGAENHLADSERNATWGEEAMMCELLDKMQRFAEAGYPVYVGEFGVLWRDLSGMKGESQRKHDASLRHFFRTFTRECMQRGYVPVVWDHNSMSFPNMTIIDREKLQMFSPMAVKWILKGARQAQAKPINMQNGTDGVINR